MEKIFFGWYPDLRAVLARAWRDQGSTSTRAVPFVLVDSRVQPLSDYVVDLDGSKHPLPFNTVYRKMLPFQASPLTLLQALCGHEYPFFHWERMSQQLLFDPQKMGCEMTQDQMIIDLSSKSKILLTSNIIVGSVYLVMPLKGTGTNGSNGGKGLRRGQQQNHSAASDETNNSEETVFLEDWEMGDVPDGQLCVICLMRTRRAAFVPCGHLVGCQRCAF